MLYGASCAYVDIRFSAVWCVVCLKYDEIRSDMYAGACWHTPAIQALEQSIACGPE